MKGIAVFLIVLLILTTTMGCSHSLTPVAPVPSPSASTPSSSVEPPAQTENPISNSPSVPPTQSQTQTKVDPNIAIPKTDLPIISELTWEFIGTTSQWEEDNFLPVRFSFWYRDQDGSVYNIDKVSNPPTNFLNPLDMSGRPGPVLLGFSADGTTCVWLDTYSYLRGIVGIRPIILSADGGKHWMKIENLPLELEKALEECGMDAFAHSVLMPSTWEARGAIREGDKIILYASYQYHQETGGMSRSKWYRAEISVTTIEGLVLKD